jgi:hypothetical protein
MDDIYRGSHYEKKQGKMIRKMNHSGTKRIQR